MQFLGEVISWSATTYDALGALREAALPTLGTIWESYGQVTPSPAALHWHDGSRPIVGTAVGPGLDHWPGDPDTRARLWDERRYRIQVVGTPPQPAPGWEILAPDARHPIRFVSRLAAFIYYPEGRPANLPLTAIGACIATDIPVYVAPHLKPAIGKGPHYVPSQAAAEAVVEGLSSPLKLGSAAFDPLEMHRRRMRFWLGAPAAPPARRKQRRVMLFASNGDGLGHITRLIAIARKLPPEVSPSFVTLSSGISLIEDAGFPVEMILSHRYANLDPAVAYAWMADELAEILARRQPDAFVFDGGNPYQFMTETVAGRRGPACLWLRRGMWQPSQDNASVIAKEKHFDVVLEPDDLAASRDRGATARRRDGVILTSPIRLVDDGEQLSRHAAQAELGLDPSRPAVLVQLGVGNVRDVSDAFNQVITVLRRHAEIQVINLVPPISHRPIRHVEGVRDMSIYPAARYLRAFDFAISAAGYNSFHELIAAAVPAIFAVTMRPELDDQMARATYAEAAGCGYAFGTDDLASLPQRVDDLMRPRHRQELHRNCARLATPNGATEAARLIAQFAR